MPNLVAHFGLQAGATRGLLRRADIKWILLGCLLPDVPWILRRVVRTLAPAVDAYALVTYLTAQGTLACTLVLAGAVALLAARPGRVLAILSLNAVLALLLDGLQTKWGNGVHLLAPFDWSMWGGDLFFPESVTTYVLTSVGLLVVLWLIARWPGDETGLALDSPRRLLGAAVLVALYVALPLAWDDDVLRADNRYLSTLRQRAERPGRYVEFDRKRYLELEGADGLRILGGEILYLTDDRLDAPATVSVRGRFTALDTLRVLDLHEHRPAFREGASYLGLALLVFVWGRWAYRRVEGSPA